ncbi:MAG: hypothetical protein WA815_16265 [Terracidiphilus sp.]
MIRQAISCDICGTEMLNANHWFVANDRGSELRISTWSARNRIKTGVRHLCGHKCLHKLVDDFMAKALSARASATVESDPSSAASSNRAASPIHTSVTCTASPQMTPLPVIGSHVQDFESSARLIMSTDQISPRGASSPTAVRAEAWKRERERQRLTEQTERPRRSIA